MLEVVLNLRRPMGSPLLETPSGGLGLVPRCSKKAVGCLSGTRALLRNDLLPRSKKHRRRWRQKDIIRERARPVA